jgi:hypothetical protein
MTTETTGDVAISLMGRIFQRRRGARENEEKFEIRNQKFEGLAREARILWSSSRRRSLTFFEFLISNFEFFPISASDA